MVRPSGVARPSWLPGLSEILPGQARSQTFLLGVLLKKYSNPSVVSKQNPDAAEVGVCIAHIHEGVTSIHTLNES